MLWDFSYVLRNQTLMEVTGESCTVLHYLELLDGQRADVAVLDLELDAELRYGGHHIVPRPVLHVQSVQRVHYHLARIARQTRHPTVPLFLQRYLP